MPEILIITNRSFPEEEFAKFVTDIGAKQQEFGRFIILNQEGYLHVILSESEMRSLLRNKARLKLVTEKLGSEPKSVIVVSIGQIDVKESQQLALMFALKVARRWGAVVDNLQPDEDHHIYPLQELEEMEQREGRWSD